MADQRRPGRSAAKSASAEAHARNMDLLRAAYDADLAGLIGALEAGADVDTADQETGLTALHIAVGMNNLAMTQALAESWSASFGPDRSGRWPTVIAAQCRVGDAMSDYIVSEEAAWLARNESA
ncbi:MAG: hypothetical protein APF80_08330 [Alphaproteobacteria bacterium BRH_c36]|nr:MAG: hypothetical protein APF80_08330 [Alphaproteobacteria bacterium BRH_c36]